LKCWANEWLENNNRMGRRNLVDMVEDLRWNKDNLGKDEVYR
jgi:hypothetical protein